MRQGRLVVLVIVCALLPAATAAGASQRFQADRADMARAMRVAVGFWDQRPCHGRVALVWRELAGDTRAEATWMNPLHAWNRPRRNFACQIAFNTRVRFTWPDFCTTMVHETGHLLGRRHSRDPRSVMYERATRPLAICRAAARR